MSVGRKRKPEKLKLIQGTARKDRENKQAPTVDKLLPESPAWLSERACIIFKTLVSRIDAMQYASVSHTEMLALAAMRLFEVEECSRVIFKFGMSYETTNITGGVVHKVRPEVAIRSEAARHAQSLLAEFGLSAASMNKIIVPNKEKPKSNTWEGFGG